MTDVLELKDHVEVRNRSAEEVREALKLLDAAKQAQDRMVRHYGQTLLSIMARAGMDWTPSAGVLQAQRLADHKANLLERGAWTYERLANATGRQEGSQRAWVTRAKKAHRLFTVRDGQRTLVPAVQLNDDGTLREDVASLVEILSPAGLDGWELWSWLCSPTSRLSGEVPAEVIEKEPERAHRAARAYARELASSSRGMDPSKRAERPT